MESFLEKAYKEEINWYIENELDYLKQENNVCGFDKEREKNILLLENTTEEQKQNIVYKMLNDNELNECLNNSIRYYLYHRGV